MLSGYQSIQALNGNFEAIENAFDNTLSRDGSTPNEMLDVLDMNGNRIINLPEPVIGSDVVRLDDMNDAIQDIVTNLAGTGMLINGSNVSMTGTQKRAFRTAINAPYRMNLGDFATGDGVTDDSAGILACFSAAAALGWAVFVPNGSYRFTSTYIDTDRLVLIGESRPGVTTDLNALQGGARFIGTCWFRGRTINLLNLGFDHGATAFPATPGDACVLQPVGAFATPGQYSSIHNCIALGRASADAYHAFAIEGHQYFQADNNIGIRNVYGMAAKVSQSQLGDFLAIMPGTRGRIIKADPAQRDLLEVSCGKTVVKGTGTTNYGVEVLIQGGPANALNSRNISVGDVVASGCKIIAGCNVENDVGGTTTADYVQFGNIIGDFTQAAFVCSQAGSSGFNLKNLKHGDINAKGLTTSLSDMRGCIYGGADSITGGHVFLDLPSGMTLEAGAFIVGDTVGHSNFASVSIPVNGSYTTVGGASYDVGLGTHFVGPGTYWAPYGAGVPRRVGLTASTVPTTGRYALGEFVTNTGAVTDGSSMFILGWLRQNTGGAHSTVGSGADWYPARVSFVSPAV